MNALCSLAKKSIALWEIDFFEEKGPDTKALREGIKSRTDRLVDLAYYLLEIALPITELWEIEAKYVPFNQTVGDELEYFDLCTFKSEFLPSRIGASTMFPRLISASLKSASKNRSPPSALSQLIIIHEQLMSHLSVYFSRLAVLSGGPARIWDTTMQCDKLAGTFLGVLSVITARLTSMDHHVSRPLQKSSNQLFTDCSILVQITEAVLSAHGDDAKEVEVTKIVQAATACIRSVGECFAFGQCGLEATGDFELQF